MKTRYRINTTNEDKSQLETIFKKLKVSVVNKSRGHRKVTYLVDLSKYELLYVKLVGKFENIIRENEPEMPL